MDHEDLDRLIANFESDVNMQTGILALPLRDWSPLFDQAKQIQEGFNTRVRYPTKQEREQAWVRFNDLRSRVYEHANKQRRKFREQSESLRNEILDSIKWAGYSWTTDVLFFFSPTTVEDMKAKGQMLREAGQVLSQNKHRMLKEHKDECFARILELRETHDRFWGEYKRGLEHRQAEYAQRRHEIVERVRGNIRANEERLEKATDAFARIRSNLESNAEKLESARSPEFIARVAGWIQEDEEKLRSISESIDRLREWIREDAERLSDLENR